MLKNRKLRSCLLLLITLQVSLNGFSQKKFDVIIYGGTAAGYSAAIQVARQGKTVAIIEPGGHIGGNVVEGLGGTDIDNHKEFQNSLAVKGIALEFYSRVAKAYGRQQAFDKMIRNKEKNPALWRMESSVAERVIKDWLAESHVVLFCNHPLSDAKNSVVKRGSKIISLKTKAGQIFQGSIFIDASIEGDLLAAASVSYTVGREANSVYNETLNGIRAETTHAQFDVKVDPFKTPREPKSGLIATIQQGPFGTPGAADKNLQAFCFRVCLTKQKDNQIAFYKPPGFNRNNYEIYLRYLRAGGKLYKPSANLPNGKTDLGAWHDLSHNLYGMNVAYPEGSDARRKQILLEHETFTKGLFYFLATDPQVGMLDQNLQNEWAGWGYAKDEFTDNNGFPRMFYVRDARRMVSDYVITEHHVRKDNPVKVSDPVCIAYWPTDVHSVRRIVKDGYAYNEGFVFGGNYWRPLPVSYRSMIPKRKQCTNLLTPTCLSSSHIAYGAVRLEWTFMALGQAAALAAVLAIDSKIAVQDVGYIQLKHELLLHGAFVDPDHVGMPED
ncbi:FAD-dependent oxidoreductase [Dyadobacter psychrotolerans]|nr:FAD-dependent oxidoreductase [Dyadobacter psychrotolerans]